VKGLACRDAGFSALILALVMAYLSATGRSPNAETIYGMPPLSVARWGWGILAALHGLAALLLLITASPRFLLLNVVANAGVILFHLFMYSSHLHLFQYADVMLVAGILYLVVAYHLYRDITLLRRGPPADDELPPPQP